MLTIGQYKNATEVTKYFEEHLSSGDYHSEKGNVQGKWVGKLVESLGLDPNKAPETAQFAQLVIGIHPNYKDDPNATFETGKEKDKYLLQRVKKDRICAWDMVFSAPKSVSILAITAQDERVRQAHERASEIAFKSVEALASTRVRKNSANDTRRTGQAIGVRFTHDLSRASDPQLHSHNVLFNVTFDPVEKRYKALNTYLMYRATRFGTEVYRNELSRLLRELGYEIEPSENTFRVKGVSRELEKLFSKRSAAINKAQASLEKKGVKVDKRGRALLAGLTRDAKDHTITEEDYLKYQHSQLTREQLETLRGLVSSSKAIENDSRLTNNINRLTVAKDAIEFAINHTFERKSVVARIDLLTEALKKANGIASIEDFERALEDKTKFIIRGDFVMTKEERNRELSLINEVAKGKFIYEAYHKDPLVFDGLTKEQANAVNMVLTSFHRHMFIAGAAGVGKSHALKKIIENVEKTVILAPTSTAKENLIQDGMDAKTLQMFLTNPVLQRASKDSLLILDEAGIVSTRQMEKLFQIANEQNLRVCLVGDTLQHNSVEGGDALRLLESFSTIATAEIRTILRQTYKPYKKAVQYLAKGQIIEGFEVFEKELKVIEEIKCNEERTEAIAKEYVDSVLNNTKTLIVAPTHMEIDAITADVRKELKAHGLIQKEDKSFDVYVPLNFTREEKRYFGSYQEGHKVTFFKDVGEFKQGEVWDVIDSSIEGVKVMLGDQEKTFKPKDISENLDVVSRKTKKFSVGESVLIRANYATDRNNKVTNGEIHKIEAFLEDGSIKLDSGKILGRDFKHLSHGYALTSQTAQGKTVDKILLSAIASGSLAVNKNMFYVACSRGKYAIKIFTDSVRELKENVSLSSSRKLVLEELLRDKIVLRYFKHQKLTIEKATIQSREKLRKWTDRVVRIRAIRKSQMAQHAVQETIVKTI